MTDFDIQTGVGTARIGQHLVELFQPHCFSAKPVASKTSSLDLEFATHEREAINYWSRREPASGPSTLT